MAQQIAFYIMNITFSEYDTANNLWYNEHYNNEYDAANSLWYNEYYIERIK